MLLRLKDLRQGGDRWLIRFAKPMAVATRTSREDFSRPPNQLWQTDFPTYLKVKAAGGWFSLSTVLDDFSRFIVAWKLYATMKAKDVTTRLDLALAASGLDRMTVVHRYACCPDNGASCNRGRISLQWPDRQGGSRPRKRPLSSADPGQDRGAGIRCSENRIMLKHYYLPGDLERQVAKPSWRITTSCPISREPRQSYPSRHRQDAPGNILLERERIKRQTIRKAVACSISSMPHNLNLHDPGRQGRRSTSSRRGTLCAAGWIVSKASRYAEAQPGRGRAAGDHLAMSGQGERWYSDLNSCSG